MNIWTECKFCAAKYEVTHAGSVMFSPASVKVSRVVSVSPATPPVSYPIKEDVKRRVFSLPSRVGTDVLGVIQPLFSWRGFGLPLALPRPAAERG